MKETKTNNPNGRPPGVPNKITREVKENARNLINLLFKKIESKKLTNAQTIELVRILMPFVCTKEEKLTVDNNMSALNELKKQLFGNT